MIWARAQCLDNHYYYYVPDCIIDCLLMHASHTYVCRDHDQLYYTLPWQRCTKLSWNWLVIITDNLWKLVQMKFHKLWYKVIKTSKYTKIWIYVNVLQRLLMIARNGLKINVSINIINVHESSTCVVFINLVHQLRLPILIRVRFFLTLWLLDVSECLGVIVR